MHLVPTQSRTRLMEPLKNLTIVDKGSNKIKILRLGLNFVSYSEGFENYFQESFSRSSFFLTLEDVKK